MTKVLLIGAYPPPVGGNSVHIKRLKEFLDTRDCLESKVLDIYSGRQDDEIEDVYRIGPPGIRSIINAIKIIYQYKPDVFHVHVSAMGKFLYIGFALIAFTPKRSNKIITIHSGSFVSIYKKYNCIKRYMAKRLLGKFNTIISVGREQKALLVNEGFNEKNIVVIPAYLPPKPERDNDITQMLNNLRATGKKILVTSGYGLSLYGYDKIIDAINADEDFNNSLALIICTYNTYDEDYMIHLTTLISGNPDIIIIRNLTPEKFAYILQSSDAYIRATDRDGDAVAIREAHYFKLPVLASDIVNRPSYCRLFKLESACSIRNGLSDLLKDGAYTFSNNEDSSIISKLSDIYGI